MNSLQEFREMFNFDPEKSLYVGIERECFLTNGTGEIVPIAERVLNSLGINDRFGYELSACQLEDRVGPCEINKVKKELLINEKDLVYAEKKLNFKRLHLEVGPRNMPLDVYPDERYAELRTRMTPKYFYQLVE